VEGGGSRNNSTQIVVMPTEAHTFSKKEWKRRGRGRGGRRRRDLIAIIIMRLLHPIHRIQYIVE